MSSLCQNDDSLGPAVQGCRGDFDFTLKFEKIFLVIIPASIFVATSLPRVAFLLQKPRIVGATWLQVLKLATATAYATLQFSLLILLTTSQDGGVDGLPIAATTLSFIAGLCMIALSFAEHSRSPRPSMLLSGYVLLTLLFDIAETRTSWLVADTFPSTIFARLFSASVAVKIFLLLAESQKKAKWVRWNAEDHSPEETSGIFSLSAYAWLNRLFLRGYRTVLSLDDLFALDQNMLAETMQTRLSNKLDVSKISGKYGLARALGRALFVPIILPIGPRVAQSAFTFCQPFFINSMLNYLQQPDGNSTKNIGYGFIGACVLIYTGIGVSTAFYGYYVQRAMYMIRACLAAAVYKKTTEVKLASADDSAAITLMSTDIERIIRGFQAFHEFWADIVEVAIGCWLLQGQVGTAFLSPLVVIMVCFAGTTWAGRLSGKRQKEWMAKIQKRVGLTVNVISNMKYLKMSGIVSPVTEYIQGLRLEDLKAGNAWRTVLILVVSFAFIPQILGPVMTYAVTASKLDVSSLFTSLSYLILVTGPFGILLQSVPGLIASFNCLDRIQAYLVAEPRVDFRRYLGPDRQMISPWGKSSSGRDAEHCSSEKQSMPPEKVISERDEVAPVPAIRIRNGSFGWSKDKMVLNNINVTVPSSKLTMIVGPVASGKSTLCKVFLGEVPFSDGTVSLGAGISSFGYCDQIPFLSNLTVQENIVGYAPFSQAKYDEIISATMLSPDITLFPSKHDTRIGSNGIMLSGGQKQRVSLARALYLESDMLLFDDILSGLDNDTATEVFRRVFGPEGLIRCRNATAVLCTHSVRYLPAADHIIALGADGTIVEEGTFDDLMKNGKYVHGLGVKATDSDSASEKEALATAKEIVLAPKPKSNELTKSLDDQERQTGDFSVYKHYFRYIKMRSIVLFFLWGGMYGIGGNGATLWMNFWAEDTFHNTASFYIGIYSLFRVVQIISLILCCAVGVLSFISQAGMSLHNNALGTVVAAPMRFFTTTDSGVITNHFSQDITLIDGELPISMLNLALDGADCLGAAAVIAVASPYMALSYPLLVAALYMIQKFYLRTSRQLRLLDLEAKSPLYTHFLDTIKGVATIRAFGWVNQEVAHNHRLLDTSQRPAYLLAMIQQWLSLMLRILVGVVAVVLTSLATQLRTNSGFTGASLVTLMGFGDTITAIIRMYTTLETSIGAVNRLKTFSEKVTPEDLPGEDIVPPEEWPQNGEVVIRDVSASYSYESPSTSGEKATEHQSQPGLALKNVTLSIKRGEKVAVVGRTGSGKSSLILLLLRLLDPLPSSSQDMTIDGLPFQRIDRATLRRRFIAVPQDAVFLPDGTSIRDNLDPFSAASDEECLAVLEMVQLASFVTERGGLHEGMTADSLSAGQRQLFSLGRAILRRRVRQSALTIGERTHGGLLLLDEISSSVDRDTDRTMQEIIKEEFKEYSIVMVTHRLDMVIDFFDRVVVMDNGAVIEEGRPTELIEIEGSRFGELWTIGNYGDRL